MAPTGRWAKGRDLTWYAKGDKDEAEKEANARKDELRRVKEAESDAMARALGLPVPDRSNPNNEALGTRKDMEKALKDTVTDEQPTAGGLGYGRSVIAAGQDPSTDDVERIEGNAEQQDKELAYALKEYKRRHRDEPRDGSADRRDRSRDRTRKHRRHRSKEREHRHRSRSRDKDSRRDRSPGRHHRSHRHRSRSPREEKRHHRRDYDRRDR